MSDDALPCDLGDGLVMRAAASDEEALATYLIYDGARPAGYFRLFPNECADNAGVRIVEASPMPYRACLAALAGASQSGRTPRHLPRRVR